MNALRGYFHSMGNSRVGRGGAEIFSSQSVWAKVVFLILVIIVFIILLRTLTSLVTWFFAPSSSPYLVKGLKNAKKLLIIPQDPKNSHSIPIIRSNNERGGIEFTWTVWLYIDDLEYKSGQRRHVFHKGSDWDSKEAKPYPNNGPGLYIHPNRNTFIIAMNTFQDVVEEVEVNDFPLNKWINVAIRQRGNIMDVFINGEIALRHVFDSVPKQNYGKVFVNMNGGFSGNMSDLWYHNYSLSGTQIAGIVENGPDLTNREQQSSTPPYFSLQWYFENAMGPPISDTSIWPTNA
tara:strand:- start:3264 stop:4136 length:873 start_codon:yes stop_codon:yes gene_type:complete